MSDEFNPESDPRLPSGEWSGFYREDHRQDQRGWMHLYINFADGTVTGEGTDYVGPWNISGNYELDSGRCSWVKQYVGKHNVQYEGSLNDQGIQGFWNIRGWHDGPFHIWPRHRHDLESIYIQDELANGPSSPPLTEYCPGPEQMHSPNGGGSEISEFLLPLPRSGEVATTRRVRADLRSSSGQGHRANIHRHELQQTDRGPGPLRPDGPLDGAGPTRPLF